MDGPGQAPGMTIFLPHAEERGTRVSKHLAPILRGAARCAAPRIKSGAGSQDEEISYPGTTAASRDRDGCFSFLSALASICLIRLPGHRELLADFFQGVVGVHADAEAHAEHAFFARGQRGQHAGGGFRAGLLWIAASIGRIAFLSSMKSPRCEIFLVAHRRLQGQRLLGDFSETLRNLLQGHAELFGEFFRRRFAADFVQHLARGAHDLVDGLDHVHGNADGAGPDPQYCA